MVQTFLCTTRATAAQRARQLTAACVVSPSGRHNLALTTGRRAVPGLRYSMPAAHAAAVPSEQGPRVEHRATAATAGGLPRGRRAGQPVSGRAAGAERIS